MKDLHLHPSYEFIVHYYLHILLLIHEFAQFSDYSLYLQANKSCPTKCHSDMESECIYETSWYICNHK